MKCDDETPRTNRESFQKRAIVVLSDYKTLQPDNMLHKALEEYCYCGRGIAGGGVLGVLVLWWRVRQNIYSQG